MNLDWDKLRIFHAVAEAGSFTHAGQALQLSQSSISRQISTLEESLGVLLFHRHARGLIMTEQGELLHSATLDVYEKLILIETQISDTKNKAAGPLKITVSGFLGATWLAPKIKDLVNTHPELKLTLLTDNRILNLSMREADVAIRMYEPQQQDLIKRKLTEIRFYICGSKQYLQDQGTPEKPLDLMDHKLIGYPSGVPYPHEHIDWIFQLGGVDKERSPNALLMNSMYGILQLVEAGLGLACLPDYMIKDNPKLVPVLPDFEAPPIEVFFVYPEERRNSARIKAFRDFLLSQVKLS